MKTVMLTVGSTAPDFTLENQTRALITLSSFRGQKNVVLAFHPLAFTPVCSAQMRSYEQAKDRFVELDTIVLGISMDYGPSKHAWALSLGGISFDLLSDGNPHGHVAKAYGVYREDGLTDRAIYVVDKACKIAWAKMHDIPEQPREDELMRVLAGL